MQCPQCRQAAPADAAFCGNCGAPLTIGSAEAAGLHDGVAVALPAETALQTVRDHSGKAVASLIIALAGLVAWLVPVAGLVIGLLAMICGTIAFHSRRRVFARSGIMLSAMVLAASLFMWVHSAQRLSGTAQAQSADTASGSLQSVTTPCYSTKVSAGLRLSALANDCSFQGSDSQTGEQQAVKLLNVPGLTAADLSDAATADVQNVVKSVPSGRLQDERSTLFAGSVAYQATIVSADGSGGVIDYVYNPMSSGNLLIITHSVVHAGSNGFDIGPVETNWSWQ